MSITMKYGEWAPGYTDLIGGPDTLSWQYGEWGVIFGSSNQICQALAVKLAQEKMKLILIDQDGENTWVPVARQISEEYGIIVETMSFHLDDPKAPEVIFKQLSQRAIGLVIYQAWQGATPWAEGERQKMMAINQTTFLGLLQRFAESWQKKGRGALLTLAPLEIKGYIQQEVTQDYLCSLTNKIAKALAPFNIDVGNAILAPEAFASGQNSKNQAYWQVISQGILTKLRQHLA